MTSESLPADTGALGAPIAARSASPWLRLAVAFLGSILAGAALFVALLVAIQIAYAGRALPGAHVGGVDLGGLTRAEAAARLEANLPALGEGTVALTIGDVSIGLGYGELGRAYNTDAMLDAAFTVGRSGDLLPRGIEELRALVRGSQHAPTIIWDEEKVAAAIRTVANQFDRDPIDAAVVGDGSGPFAVTEATWGRKLDQAAAANDIRVLLETPAAPSQVGVTLVVKPVVPAVLTGEAQFARNRAEAIAAQDLTVYDGKDKWVIRAREIRSWISFEAAPPGGLRVEVAGPDLQATLKALAKKVARKPKDAAFLTGKTGVIVGVVPGVNGRALDIPNTTAAIAAALDQQAAGSPPPRVQLAVTITQPKLTTEEASKVAPLMTRLSTWTTYFPVYEGNFFGNNITIPARIIAGTVVPSGAWFSFWDTVGIPTAAQGYGPGGVIINGHSDPTGAFAGGICSTSTTLFNAAVRAGLQIGARANHYYYIPRYPLGLDATVFMSSWTSRQDMTFRNDMKYPILIRSFSGYGWVRFDIYGVPDGRTVRFSTPIVKNVVKASDSTVYTTAIPAGTEKRVEFPHDGMDVWVTRTVVRKGVVIHKETFYSDYRRVDGILWIGVAAT